MLLKITQIIIAAGLINVWILRFNRKTAFRGAQSGSMPEEFAVYGLPKWSMWLVCFLKLTSALCLLCGLWVPFLVAPASAVVTALMVGAIVMHLKVGDPWIKSLPALVMLVLNAFVLRQSL